MLDMILEVRGLSGGYGDLVVVRDISLNVRNGIVISITGRNGVGKTTLAKANLLIKQKTRQYAKRQFTWARGHMKSWDMIYSSDLEDLFRKVINNIS